jgi:hypothetical protein
MCCAGSAVPSPPLLPDRRKGGNSQNYWLELAHAYPHAYPHALTGDGLRRAKALFCQTIRVPAGTAQWVGDPGDQIAHARVRRALRMEELFATTAAIGRADAGGRGFKLAPLTHRACVAFEFRREVVAPIAWLGRRRFRSAEPAPASRARSSTR